jgi:glycosyltransferase involved in cell wall biosynthesis
MPAISQTKRRLLYFSIGTFAPTPYELGGNIYAKNLIQRLVADEFIDLFVVNVNAEAHRGATQAFFQALGIECLYLVPRPIDPRAPTGMHNRLRSSIVRRFTIPHEREALDQPEIAKAANAAVRRWGIDHILVDYLLAAPYWNGLEQLPIPKTLVTVNREADIHAEAIATWRASRGRAIDFMTHWRLARFERRTHWAFDKVVALSAPDVPPYLPASRTAVVTSYLDKGQARWEFQGNKTVFFVGNVDHYPNRLAIDHIVEQLAPRVLARMPEAKFIIIGAAPDQVSARHHHPAIKLMGASTPAEVKRMFTSTDLFICPIENDFGMKFKVAEAAAFGAPFVASEQTMLGFPYLRGLPELTLADPDRSASMICDLLSDGDKLKELSAEILRRQSSFAETQKNVWSRTVFLQSTPAAVRTWRKSDANGEIEP